MMSKKRVLLIIQGLLCILIAAVLSVLTVRTYMEGIAWQAAGHPSDWIFTREKAGKILLTVLPLVCASAAVTIACLVKDIRDEEAEKPVRDPGAVKPGAGIYNTEPETAGRPVRTLRRSAPLSESRWPTLQRS